MSKRMNDILYKKWDEKYIKDIVELAFFCGAPTVLMIGIMVILSIPIISRNIHNQYLLFLLQQSVPIAISFVLIPCFIFTLIMKNPLNVIGVFAKETPRTKYINMLVLAVFAIYVYMNKSILNILWIYIIHFLVIAVSEEVLVRGIILYQLEKMYHKGWVSILISALLFAMIFHSGGNIVDNLLVRFPFGIIAAYMCKKSGSLTLPIIFHWIYNVVLTAIEI